MRGERASSLNNASNSYSDLAGLETTREGRGDWLTKAVEAAEEAVEIYRELGVRGGLAGSLNNASNRYNDLAGLETTREGCRAWLTKAIEAVEESITIRCELGVPSDLASSLNTASNGYSKLASLETTREGRGAWLTKAVEAVEAAITIRRELGVRGELAMSLGSMCQHQRGLAEAAVDVEEVGRRLMLSREAIDESVALFREAGNTPYLLLALQEAVVSRALQVQAGIGVDREEWMVLIEEGLVLARSMEDEQAVGFFTNAKRAVASE